MVVGEEVLRAGRYRMLVVGSERSVIEKDELDPSVRVVVSRKVKCVLSEKSLDLRSVCYSVI